MLNNTIAYAYLTPTRNIQVPSTPGRRIKFYGGQAKITDERDIATLLRRDDILLEMTDEWLERLPQYVDLAGRDRIKATVTCDGASIDPKTYAPPVIEAEPPDCAPDPEEETVEAIAASLPKRKPGRPKGAKNKPVVAQSGNRAVDLWTDDLLEDQPH